MTERLELRVGKEELGTWRAAAERSGKPLSFYVRRAMRTDVEYDAVDHALDRRRD